MVFKAFPCFPLEQGLTLRVKGNQPDMQHGNNFLMVM